MKNHDEIHQKVQLPRLNFDRERGREIFATWKPLFSENSQHYYTDSNGFEFIRRKVSAKAKEESFSKTFYPISSAIVMEDNDQ